MERHWHRRAPRFVLFAVLFAVAAGFVVMGLWNWLMPALFGLRQITFWQALGVLLLSKLLLGGFHGHHGPRGHWRGRMTERWEKMTPEEREKFRETMRHGCGPFGGPEAGEPSGV